ncbi:hypothetical protein EIP86_000521 [Pleurotus ostreatoroseus]|nr:hypothetical protein EIP86_000521 [Pleurotus ostreatoroseus]
MQGLVQYLMDTYTIYCASALASTVILRSVLAAVFPLICPIMFKNLGNHWGMMVFTLLSVACTPLPFLFFKYGPWIRSKSKFASGHAEPASFVVSSRVVAPVSDKTTFIEGSEKEIV